MPEYPYIPDFPLDYTPGGDTSATALWKHAQEIIKIYNLLDKFDRENINPDEFQNLLTFHINGTDPHPNWHPKIPIEDVEGDIPAERVVGELINATIPVENVTGLEDFINELFPDDDDDEDDPGEDEPPVAPSSTTFLNISVSGDTGAGGFTVPEGGTWLFCAIEGAGDGNFVGMSRTEIVAGGYQYVSAHPNNRVMGFMWQFRA
jgi:hypothetical protein